MEWWSVKSSGSMSRICALFNRFVMVFSRFFVFCVFAWCG